MKKLTPPRIPDAFYDLSDYPRPEVPSPPDYYTHFREPILEAALRVGEWRINLALMPLTDYERLAFERYTWRFVEADTCVDCGAEGPSHTGEQLYATRLMLCFRCLPLRKSGYRLALSVRPIDLAAPVIRTINKHDDVQIDVWDGILNSVECLHSGGGD